MVFTGIIKAVGSGSFDKKTQILEVQIPGDFWQGLAAGDSVAVDGVCLTLLEEPSSTVPGRFFLQKETLQCTTYGDADWQEVAIADVSKHHASSSQARAVNVEAAMQMHDRLSGHVVLGHVHGVGKVDAVQRNGDGSVDVWIAVPINDRPAHIAGPLVVHKGSIALDGVSLTIAQVDESGQRIRVSLIPYTLGHTTLQHWQVGRRVNVEFAIDNAKYDGNGATPASASVPVVEHRRSAKQELAPMPKWMGLDYVSEDELRWNDDAAATDDNANDQQVDLAFMNEAIAIGEQGRTIAPPNPWVGCVIVDATQRRVLGRGFHSGAGQPHAEVQALCNALLVQYPDMKETEARAILSAVADNGQRLNFLTGATLYVSLEPCTHFASKRTPPCDALLSGLGLARVVVAIEDPDERVRGRGVACLRQAGLRVDVGIGATQALKSLAAYIKHRSTGLPYVVCKAAYSLDGAIAAHDGSSKWITDQASRQHAHRTLRAQSSAIVVGSGTALADNPELTVRYNIQQQQQQQQSLRVLLDSRGRVESGHLLRNDVAPTLIFTSAQSRGTVARSRWLEAGVEVIELPSSSRVALDQVLQTLGNRGILQVLFEGGATLQSSLLKEGLVDRLVVYQGGALLGSTSTSWIRQPLTSTMSDVTDAHRWRAEHVQIIGTGIVTEWVPLQSANSAAKLLASTSAEEDALDSNSEEAVRARVAKAVEAIRKGGMVLVLDDLDRENEADIIVAAGLVSESQVATMIRHTTGILCTPMPSEHAKRLRLPLMVENNEDTKKTAFTVSCDAIGVSTGVSAADRALTSHLLASATSEPSDFTRPGHIFPLIEHPGSVHARGGHTEASVALCRLAGIEPPIALIGELTNDDGTMSRLDDARLFARAHGGLPLLTVADLQRVVPKLSSPESTSATATLTQEEDKQVEESATLETDPVVIPLWRDGQNLGDWTVQLLRTSHPANVRSVGQESEIVALIKGDVASLQSSPALCRVHSECFTGDCLGSAACDCQVQLAAALKAINDEGAGIVLYVLKHEGRGIGLVNKLKAYALMQRPGWTGHTYSANAALGFAADERLYEGAAAALNRLGVHSVRLLSNNPTKISAIQAAGIQVTRVALHACPLSDRAAKYLNDKQSIGNHHPLDDSQERSTDASDSAAASAASSSDSAATSHKSLPVLGGNLTAEQAAALRITIVRTAWNASLVDALEAGVIERLHQQGVVNIRTIRVGGAYELPLTAKRAASVSDAVVAIGILIKGDTMHFEYISSAVSSGLMTVQLETDTPIIYGVLNVLAQHQAVERCDPNSGLAHSWADTAIAQITNDPRKTAQ